MTLAGAAWVFPARSIAPAQVAVKEPTPWAPVVVTVREAGVATTESSVVWQPGGRDRADDVVAVGDWRRGVKRAQAPVDVLVGVAAVRSGWRQ